MGWESTSFCYPCYLDIQLPSTPPPPKKKTNKNKKTNKQTKKKKNVHDDVQLCDLVTCMDTVWQAHPGCKKLGRWNAHTRSLVQL